MQVYEKRSLSAILFLFAFYCGYGFLASFEPGEGHETWRGFYTIAGILSLLLSVILGLKRSK